MASRTTFSPGRLAPPFLSSVAIVVVCAALVPGPAIAFATGARGQDDGSGSLPAGIQIVVSGHDLPPGSYGMLVQEVFDREPDTFGDLTPVLAVNLDVPFNPASTIKTLTTLAGLELLGTDYVWETEIYAMGPVVDGTLDGDLLIRGGGDPFLVEEHFRAMLKALERRGVRRIGGDLVIDDTFFDPSVASEPTIDDQNSRSYNVAPHALAANFQTVNFYFYPDANGRDVMVRPDPALPNLAITNRLGLVDAPCGGFQRGIRFDIDPTDANGVIFSGQYPSRCTEYVLSRAVLDAGRYAYGLFRVLWSELGGEFGGGLRWGEAPEDAEPLVRWSSPPLGDVIKSINKYSNNLMTRQLLLTIGAERFGTPATVRNGIRAVEDYLDSRAIARDGLVLVNGAGLSRDTRATVRMLGDVMGRGYGISTMAEFVASLPLAGVDGTMRTRSPSEASRGNIHVKTGSLEGVAAVAGYVHARSGRNYVVVGMLNHPLADGGPGEELMDALLGWAYEQ